VATTAVEPLLSEKRRYPKYGGFTLIPARIKKEKAYTNMLEVDGWLNIGMILTLVHMRLGTELSAAKPKLPAQLNSLRWLPVENARHGVVIRITPLVLLPSSSGDGSYLSHCAFSHPLL
jgi:hypothetical protein